MENIEYIFWGLLGFCSFVMLIIMYMFMIMSKTMIRIEVIRKCETYNEIKDATKTAVVLKKEDKITKEIQKNILEQSEPDAGDSDWVPGVGEGYDFTK